MAHRLQQVVDTLLRPHDTDIADQVFAATLERFIGRQDAQAIEFRAAADHVDLVRGHAAAFDGDALVRLVGGDRDVGSLERPAFEQQHQVVKEVAPPELGFVQFRIDVMMVEQEFLAHEQLEKSGDQEEQVGRIAGMDNIEAVRELHLPGQARGVEQGEPVLQQVADGPLCLDRQVVAVDVDAVERLIGFFISLAGRADDRHLVAVGVQRRRFLPYAPVERRRQILYQDQDTARFTSRCHRIVSRCALWISAPGRPQPDALADGPARCGTLLPHCR